MLPRGQDNSAIVHEIMMAFIGGVFVQTLTWIFHFLVTDEVNSILHLVFLICALVFVLPSFDREKFLYGVDSQCTAYRAMTNLMIFLIVRVILMNLDVETSNSSPKTTGGAQNVAILFLLMTLADVVVAGFVRCVVNVFKLVSMLL